MGYEVLDDGRGAIDVANDPARGPVDVVALDDLPPAEVEWGPRRPRQVPTGIANALHHLTPAIVGALAVAVLIGVGAGAWVAHRRGVADAQARASGAVSAFALVAGVDSYPSGTGQLASYTLRVFNLGDRPIEVVASDAARGRPASEPVFSIITGDGTLAPGRDALVRAQVPIDCASTQELALQVPVRSQDGRTHEVPVRPDTNVGISQTPQWLCSQNQHGDPLPVQLTGSLRSPVLELTNPTDRPLTVSLDSGSPLTQAASEYLALTTRPALPLVIAPNASRRLNLQLTVQGCHRDLGALAGGGTGSLNLRIEGNPGGPMRTFVDVSTLVGAALERSCR